jgi:diketogulonate reductase-like aldo/keto reductase
MEFRPFGPTKREVSVIGEGTWYFERSDRREAIAALQKSVDLGINHIDTAELYGNGEAERIIGESISDRRDKLFLVSKVRPDHASRKGTIKACDGSLSRLETDHLDCYLLHWRGSYPLEQTIEAFEELKRDKKVLSWGVSNFGVTDLEEAEDIAGSGRIACDQVLYHLNDRSIETDVIPWCEKHGVAVVAYSPFGHGNFPSSQSDEGKLLAEIAKFRDATPRQVALAFLSRRESVFVIPKGASPKHVIENAGGSNVRLTKDDIERISKAFPVGASSGYPPW